MTAAVRLNAVAALLNAMAARLSSHCRTICYLASLPPYPLCLHHATNGEASNNPRKEDTKLQAYCATHCTLHFTRAGKREENTRIHGSYGVTVCCWRRRRRREPNLIDLYLLYYNIYVHVHVICYARGAGAGGLGLVLGPGCLEPLAPGAAE